MCDDLDRQHGDVDSAIALTKQVQRVTLERRELVVEGLEGCVVVLASLPQVGVEIMEGGVDGCVTVHGTSI